MTRGTAQRGFTLIEVMIVVAIVGILAAIAVSVFRGAPKKARATEVHALFAEIRTRQLQYHNEFNTYLSTGNEAALHPGPVTNSARPVLPLPAEWQSLRIRTTKDELYCAYVTVAGAANDGSNIGPLATGFGFVAPTRDWFYILAECDFDGNAGTNARFFVHSGTDRVLEENPTN